MLDQAAVQIARGPQTTPPAHAWCLLPELLRDGIACLALGFADLAGRLGADVSLLHGDPLDPHRGDRWPAASLWCSSRVWRAGLGRLISFQGLRPAGTAPLCAPEPQLKWL